MPAWKIGDVVRGIHAPYPVATIIEIRNERGLKPIVAETAAGKRVFFLEDQLVRVDA